MLNDVKKMLNIDRYRRPNIGQQFFKLSIRHGPSAKYANPKAALQLRMPVAQRGRRILWLLR